MAPKETLKPPSTPKVQKTIVRTVRKPVLKDKTPMKGPKTHAEPRQRTRTVPKENKPAPAPTPVKETKTPKKKPSWQRRPKPAHSGVPVPEKMKKLLQDENFLLFETF